MADTKKSTKATGLKTCGDSNSAKKDSAGKNRKDNPPTRPPLKWGEGKIQGNQKQLHKKWD